VNKRAPSAASLMCALNTTNLHARASNRKVMQAEIIEMYVDFAVPAVALALATLLSFPGAFVFFFATLGVTGRGLPDLVSLVENFPEFIAEPLGWDVGL